MLRQIVADAVLQLDLQGPVVYWCVRQVELAEVNICAGTLTVIIQASVYVSARNKAVIL